MKLLHFALITVASPQWGLRKALQAVATTKYEEYSWYPLWSQTYGQDNSHLVYIREEFLKVAKEMQPDLIFCQIQTPNILPGAVLDRLPGQVVSWCGDLRDETPEWAWKVAPHVTVNCFSNERDVHAMRARGMRAEFLNIGFSTDVFCPDGEQRPGTPEIIFAGTNYAGRFPCSAQRQRIVSDLRSRYGRRFAVYGNGWGAVDVFLEEPAEAAAYRTCKIALDINHYQNVDRFTSDRRFRAMGSGAFVLANWHPRIEEDFNVGEHLVTFKDEHEIPKLIDYYLQHEDERQRIAAAGCAHVHANHTWDCRMQQMLEFLPKYAKVAA